MKPSENNDRLKPHKIWKALTDWKNWVIFLVLWFFTGGWFLYVLGWIFNIPELHVVATAYVTLIGTANPFIPVIPITIGLTLGLRKLLRRKNGTKRRDDKS